MSIARMVGNALAWAGLVVVVAVPAAGFIMSKFPVQSAAVVETEAPKAKPVVAATADEPAPHKVTTTPVAPVVVANVPKELAPQPVVTPAPAPQTATTDTAPATDGAGDVPADPIGQYLTTNKQLPSYLTSSKPKAAAAAPAATPPPAVQQASIPAQPAAAAPAVVTAPAVVAPAPAVIDTTADATAPKPMSSAKRPRPVTEADLKDWKSGTLEDYLKQHNLLSADPNAAPAN